MIPGAQRYFSQDSSQVRAFFRSGRVQTGGAGTKALTFHMRSEDALGKAVQERMIAEPCFKTCSEGLARALPAKALKERALGHRYKVA